MADSQRVIKQTAQEHRDIIKHYHYLTTIEMINLMGVFQIHVKNYED